MTEALQTLIEGLTQLAHRVQVLESLETPVVGGGGGGSAAPANATYLTLSLHAGLTAERRFVLAGGAGAMDGGPNGNYTVTVHDAVTLGGGSDPALTLVGQQLTLADVLTPAEHTAIGNGAPHHAAVTLDANADTLLGLTGQQINLDAQVANRVFAGPAAGGAAVPTFRALVAADLPSGGWGSGTAGRVTQWAAGGATLEDSTLVKSGAGVLTLSAAGAYTFTVPATGTPLMLDQSTPQTLTASPIFNNLTAGRIPFASSTKTLTDSADLFWDNTNRRLGIGTTGPTHTLHVNGASGTGVLLESSGNNYVKLNRVSASVRNELQFQTAGSHKWSVGQADSDQLGNGTEFFIGQTIGGTTPSLVVNTANNVGIGTTSPTARLTVLGSSNIQQLLVTGHTTQAVATPLVGFTRNDTAAGVAKLLGLTGLGSGADLDGVSVDFYAKSSTNPAIQQARIYSQWAAGGGATHATRKAQLVGTAWDTAEREGWRIGASGSAPMLSFYGGTPVVRGAALTTQLTTITHTAPGAPDYAIQDFLDVSGGAGWAFASQDEANTVLSVIANLQVRLGELEARLNAATGVNLIA